ncbi:MAG: flagellar protein [Lachnospiraceae bacterium]|nr:flagellar protein [Lachnospiraceae bacterium]
MDVRNCKSCGRLFNYTGKSICPECLKKKDDDFVAVKAYIRENPTVGIADVAEATDVSVNQIRQWIREERLILTEACAEAGINCEGCGRPIQTGRLCKSCKGQMSRDLNQAFVATPKPSGDDPSIKSKKGDRMRYLSKN